MEEERREENDIYIPPSNAPRRRKYEEEEDDSHEYEKKIRIILVGRTGNGKSSVGNSIIGYTGFKSCLSPSSITQKGDLKQMMWDDKVVVEVVDTPGFFDTDKSVEKVALEIIQSFGMIAPGPHVILYVLSCGEKYTNEEEQTLKDFEEIFSGDVLKYMIVCFTGKDLLVGKSTDSFLRDVPKWMRDFMKQIDNRTFFINNKVQANETQFTELLDMIEQVLNKNDNGYYSNEILRAVTEQLELKCIQKDPNSPFLRKQIARIKRNIASQGSYFDILKSTFVSKRSCTGVVVGAIVGFLFGHFIIGAVAGGVSGTVVSQAIILLKSNKHEGILS